MKQYNKLFAILFAVLGVTTLQAQNWEDKTSLLVNPSFESTTGATNLKDGGWNAPGNGWTFTPSTAPANSQAGVAQSNCTIQGLATTLPTSDGGKYFYVRTNWNNDVTFSLTQTVSNAPAGLYRLTCKAANNSGNWTTSKFNLTIKEGDSNAATNSTLKSQSWTDWSVCLYKKDSSTPLTIEATMYPGSSGSGQHYQLLLDDFKLEYQSFDDINAAGWPEPVVPGSNISGLIGTSTNVGMYNVRADAFTSRGMTWGTQAIATKLHNSDTKDSERHRVQISAGNGNTIKFRVSDKQWLGVGGQGSTTNSYTDNGSDNVEFNYSIVDEGHVYSLKVATAINDVDAYLDVAQPYGGQLTYANGQDFTEWAFIKISDIENGKYAQYKAKKAMYEVYQAVVAAGHTATYSNALRTALETYIRTDVSAADVTAATKTLVEAVSPALTKGYINANALFTNPDMRGAGTKADWTSGYTNLGWGVFENYHTNHGDRKLTQTKTVPNGFYKVVFHGIWRQDGSDAAPKLTLTSGNNSISANVPCMTDIAFGVGNTNGSNNWKEVNGKIIPNGMQSAGEGLSHRDAQVTISDFVVSNDQLTIEMNTSSSSQWILAQGFDIYFKAESLDEYADLFYTAKDAVLGINENTLNTYAANLRKTALSNAESEQINKEWYQTRTKELNDVIALANDISKPYKKALDFLTTCESIRDNSVEFINGALETFSTAISTARTNLSGATTSTKINEEYSKLEEARRTYVKQADPDEGFAFEYTFLLANPSFESGNTDGWTTSSGGDTGAKLNSNGTYTINGADGEFVFNTWGTENMHVQQILTNIPTGSYTLKAIVASDANNVITLTAGEQSVEVKITTDKSTATEGVVETTYSSGEFIIKASSGTWFKADHFRLYFNGFDVETAKKAISDLTIKASELSQKPMNAGYKQALIDAIDEADDVRQTRIELTKMIDKLNEVIAEANSSIAIYEEIAGYISMTEVFTEVPKYKQKYANGEFAHDKIEIIRQDLNVIRFNAASKKFQNKIDVKDWTGTMGGKNTSGQHWDGTSDENATKYYDNNSWGGTSHSTTTSITLPPGTYVLKAALRSHEKTTMTLTVLDQVVNVKGKGDAGYGIDTNGDANFSTEGTYANGNAGRGWEWEFVMFELKEETNVTLTVECNYNGVYGWASFSDITLWMDGETYVAVYGQELVAPLAEAKTLVDTEPMGTAENTALTGAIEMGEGEISGPAELNAAVDALKKAVADANKWVKTYNEEKVELVKAFERFEADFNDGANGALRKMSDDAWSTLLDAVIAAATAKDVTNDHTGLQQAAEDFNKAMDAAEFAIANYLIDTNNGDITGLIKNADFTDGINKHNAPNWGTIESPTEWIFEHSLTGWEQTNVVEDTGVKAFNVWSAGMDTEGAYAELKQTISFLPNGTYRLSADIITNLNADGGSWVAIYAVPLSAEGNPSDENIARSKNVTNIDAYGNYEVYFKVEHNAAVVGVRTDKRFFKIKNIKLEKVEDNATKVDNGILLQKAFENRSATSWDITNFALNASDAEIYLDNPNAIVYANDGQVQWPNTVVDGKAASFTLTEGNTFYSDRDFAATTLTYNRELSDNWLTVCLPFNYTILENVKVETLSEIDTETKTFTFDEVTGTMEANKPYIVKNSTGAAALFSSVEGATIEATPEAMKVIVNGIDAEFVGTYTTKTSTELMEITDEAAKYDILFFGTDGQLYYLSQGVTTKNITFKPFRAYIRIPKGKIDWSDGQQARVRHRNSEMTDIDTLESADDSQKTTVIYDMHGRRVTEMVKGGMYIVNGKKVIVK